MTLPPGPRSLFPGQQLLGFLRDPIAYTGKNFATYGPVFHVRMFGRDAFFCSDAAWIHEVLVAQAKHFIKSIMYERMRPLTGNGLLNSEGDFHRKQRRLAQPSFSRQRIAGYAKAMRECSDRMTAEWKEGDRLDIHDAMMRLSLSVAGRTLFDLDLEAKGSVVGKALETILSLFFSRAVPLGPLYTSFPWVFPSAWRMVKAIGSLDGVILEMIAERRRTGCRGDDLLSSLIQASDAEGKEGMTDRQLRDELITFLLAGHETTANALSWTWYLLSQNPDAEAKLHAEIDRVLAGRAPTIDDVPALAYANRVLTESMRLFPPAYQIGRRAARDVTIQGQPIRAGGQVMLNQFHTHRSPRYYPDPEKFDPDRWTDEFRRALPKGAYFPFGLGTRQCIGEDFAWIEATLLLADVARAWRPRVEPGHVPGLSAAITLRPKGRLPVVLERRPQHSAGVHDRDSAPHGRDSAPIPSEGRPKRPYTA